MAKSGTSIHVQFLKSGERISLMIRFWISVYLYYKLIFCQSLCLKQVDNLVHNLWTMNDKRLHKGLDLSLLNWFRIKKRPVILVTFTIFWLLRWKFGNILIFFYDSLLVYIFSSKKYTLIMKFAFLIRILRVTRWG